MHGNFVKVYSKAKDGNTKLSKNFKVREFACQDGTDTIFISPQLVTLLQNIRDHFGKPVIISSGYRTEAHNKKVDGSPYSQHKYGMACDIRINGISPVKIADYAETKMPHSGGIGIYPNFCHLDVRDDKSRF